MTFVTNLRVEIKSLADNPNPTGMLCYKVIKLKSKKNWKLG